MDTAAPENKYLEGYREAELKALEIAPIFMQDLGNSEMVSCMHYGLAWGEGWDEAFLKLAEKIEAINEKLYYTEIVADQCKEKFGTAEVYWSFHAKKDADSYDVIAERELYRDTVRDLINDFRHETENLCEYCGKDISQESYRTRRYISYLCKDCAEKTTRPYIKEK